MGLQLVRIRVTGTSRLPTAYALAAGEQALNMALGAGGRTGRGYVVEAVVGEHSLLLGLYNQVPDEAGGLGVYRRVTGGWWAPLEPGDRYLALVLPSKTLEEAVATASRLAGCSGAVSWGATVVEDWGFIELLAPTSPEECLRGLGEQSSRIAVPVDGLERLAKAYMSPSWRLYSIPQRETVVSASVRRGEYTATLAVEVYDVYISDAWIAGVFHAAPPMEPFSLVATVKGTRLDEIVVANLEVALTHRLQLYGVTREDLLGLIWRLHRLVGGEEYRGSD